MSDETTSDQENSPSPKEKDTGKTGEKSADTPPQEKEIGGRGGLEPTRYGDWEIGGIASDF